MDNKDKEKEKKTNKKPKKEKRVIVPFDKIDVTTATDDDIIRSGIKHNTPKDITCYTIMFVIFLFAILPPALRFIIPRPVTTEEREIVYLKLTCYKTTNRDNWELSTTLVSNYRDGNVNNSNFSFVSLKRNEQAKDGYVFAEVEELEKIKHDGVKVKEDGGKTIIDVDFEKYPELKDDEVLKDYAYFSSAEISFLQNEKGFSCISDSESKMEVVYIDTGKKVE